ncbi:MAG: hypothetical protein NC548_45690 [Lachnospiraceae bacterium]|nr:hypothetical protein [Lachnospiraceae bacterium]
MYRVIIASYDTWVGGTPYEDDKFEVNADRLGTDVLEDSSVTNNSGIYITLPRDTIFYHATSSDKVDTILSEGLRMQSRSGKQTSGVYLTGGKEDLKNWRGAKTVVLQVIVPRGTRVYQDFQPNAVYVTRNIPPENIKLV